MKINQSTYPYSRTENTLQTYQESNVSNLHVRMDMFINRQQVDRRKYVRMRCEKIDDGNSRNN